MTQSCQQAIAIVGKHMISGTPHLKLDMQNDQHADFMRQTLSDCATVW